MIYTRHVYRRPVNINITGSIISLSLSIATLFFRAIRAYTDPVVSALFQSSESRSVSQAHQPTHQRALKGLLSASLR